MDELAKYRITGALVWLGLLIFIVPVWYSDPVDYVKSQQLFSIETLSSSDKVNYSFEQPLTEGVKSPATSPDQGSLPSVSLPLLKVDSETEAPVGQWLVRLASYSNVQSAHRMVDQLADRYQATIGDFSSQDRRIYSVRVGPFNSFAQAQQAKKTLDTEFNIDAVVVRVR